MSMEAVRYLGGGLTASETPFVTPGHAVMAPPVAPPVLKPKRLIFTSPPQPPAQPDQETLASSGPASENRTLPERVLEPSGTSAAGQGVGAPPRPEEPTPREAVRGLDSPTPSQASNAWVDSPQSGAPPSPSAAEDSPEPGAATQHWQPRPPPPSPASPEPRAGAESQPSAEDALPSAPGTLDDTASKVPGGGVLQPEGSKHGADASQHGHHSEQESAAPVEPASQHEEEGLAAAQHEEPVASTSVISNAPQKAIFIQAALADPLSDWPVLDAKCGPSTAAPQALGIESKSTAQPLDAASPEGRRIEGSEAIGSPEPQLLSMKLKVEKKPRPASGFVAAAIAALGLGNLTGGSPRETERISVQLDSLEPGRAAEPGTPTRQNAAESGRTTPGRTSAEFTPKILLNPDDFDATWFTGRLSLPLSPDKPSESASSSVSASPARSVPFQRTQKSGDDAIPSAMQRRVLQLAAAQAAGENLSRSGRRQAAPAGGSGEAAPQEDLTAQAAARSIKRLQASGPTGIRPALTADRVPEKPQAPMVCLLLATLADALIYILKCVRNASCFHRPVVAGARSVASWQGPLT